MVCLDWSFGIGQNPSDVLSVLLHSVQYSIIESTVSYYLVLIFHSRGCCIVHVGD